MQQVLPGIGTLEIVTCITIHLLGSLQVKSIHIQYKGIFKKKSCHTLNNSHCFIEILVPKCLSYHLHILRSFIILFISNFRAFKIQASYTLEGTVLENVDNIKYLGVTITNDLKWNTHISNICTKANRTLGFLRRTLFSCPQNVKEAAYKGMVRPILESNAQTQKLYL